MLRNKMVHFKKIYSFGLEDFLIGDIYFVYNSYKVYYVVHYAANT